ncbi:MAG: DUF420 domain-containing protein [SAR324 cluster bacterium]|jgi:putative membrane protein|nr:DUF420 domain-containing protein [SAR324 cluster bacterium]
MNLAVSNRTATSVIGVISVGVFVFLLWLLYLREPVTTTETPDFSFMPLLNAILNGLSACCIAVGVWAIRNDNRTLHIRMMLSALTFSAVFLVGYIVYHSFHGNTRFQGEGLIRGVYLFILFSHIVLSAVMLPMIFSTVFFAGAERFESHRKLARWTFPIWLYVSVTGVLVYLILKHWPFPET